MSNIFATAVSGVSKARTFVPLKERTVADIPIGKVIPMYSEFVVPGDIWHFKQQIFLRAQPMLAPLLTNLNARVRGWFIPLRQIEENTELIITGSKNGKFDKTVEIPSFKGMFDDVPVAGTTAYDVVKYSTLDYMFGMPLGNYKKIKTDAGLPAQYWLKAYYKIWFDFYRHEDLSSYDDFETFWDTIKVSPGNAVPFYANWSRDYLTSALPFQQKGIAPTLQFALYSLQNDELVSTLPVGSIVKQAITSSTDVVIPGKASPGHQVGDFVQYKANGGDSAYYGDGVVDTSELYSNINTADIRLLTQTQRILERLARCGSRYTEYLNANFGIAPADETLQRVKYLGGYKTPIVVSQVEQTAPGDSTYVGTLRGKGVGFQNGGFETFVCKEFGVVFITLEIMPKATYTQGINRKYTYKNRFDFLNPSFQNLSEQEIRNSEVYVELNPAEGKEHINDETFGFTEMYNELRSNRDKVCGDMRDSQDYWTMARYFANTPVLSEEFIQARDSSAFSEPFAVTDKPQFICEFFNNNGVYRPLTKFGTPGYADHH